MVGVPEMTMSVVAVVVEVAGLLAGAVPVGL